MHLLITRVSHCVVHEGPNSFPAPSDHCFLPQTKAAPPFGRLHSGFPATTLPNASTMNAEAVSLLHV